MMFLNDKTRVMTLGKVGMGKMPFTHSPSPFLGLGDITFDETQGSQVLDNGGLYSSPEALRLQQVVGVGISAIGGILSGIHGYYRTKHIGWTVGWAILGLIAPVPAVAFSIGQGFTKRKGRR